MNQSLLLVLYALQLVSAGLMLYWHSQAIDPTPKRSLSIVLIILTIVSGVFNLLDWVVLMRSLQIVSIVIAAVNLSRKSSQFQYFRHLVFATITFVAVAVLIL